MKKAKTEYNPNVSFFKSGFFEIANHDDGLVLVKAIGDGSCAYNAFTLGLVDLIFAHREYFRPIASQGKFKRFLEIRKQSWEEFEQFLDSNKSDARYLQNNFNSSLRTLLRDLMIKPRLPEIPKNCQLSSYSPHEYKIYQYNIQDFLRQHIELRQEFGTLLNDLEAFMRSNQLDREMISIWGNDYASTAQRAMRSDSRDETSILLIQAYQDFLKKKELTVFSDLYLSCIPIRQQFEQLSNQAKNEDDFETYILSAKMIFLKWYIHEGGFEQFRDYMTDVDKNSYGGANELCLLADYFQIGLHYVKDSAPAVQLSSGVVVDKQALENVKPDHIQYLLTHGILDHNANDRVYSLQISDKDKIRRLCKPLPEDLVRKLNYLYQDARDDKHSSISYVSDSCAKTIDFTEDVMQTLSDRTLLKKVNSKYQICIDDQQRFTRYCQGIPEVELENLILTLVPTQREQFFVCLKHRSEHWDYLRVSSRRATWPELEQVTSTESKFVSNPIDSAMLEWQQLQHRFINPNVVIRFKESMINFLQYYKQHKSFKAEVSVVFLVDWHYRKYLPPALNQFVMDHAQPLIQSVKAGLQEHVAQLHLQLQTYSNKNSGFLGDGYRSLLENYCNELAMGIEFEQTDFITDDRANFLSNDPDYLSKTVVLKNADKDKQRTLFSELLPILRAINETPELIRRYQSCIGLHNDYLIKQLSDIRSLFFQTALPNFFAFGDDNAFDLNELTRNILN